MKKTELKRKKPISIKQTALKRTPLKTKTGLKSKCSLASHKGLSTKTTLKSNSVLKTKTPLMSRSELKAKSTPRVKQKTARKNSAPYFSIFGALDVCYITGSKEKDGYKIVPHHIFEGPYKAASEKYGFILPIRIDWHTGFSYSIHEDIELSLKYKRICQDYYINVLNKSEDNFIREFGHLY